MRYFPLFLDTHNKTVLVVGAGEVASRKVELLMKTDAAIHVVAPQVSDTIQRYANQQRIKLSIRPFSNSDLQGCAWVFVATSDEQLNSDIHALAQEHKLPVNVVDNPELCDFITPSIIERDPITIAMASGGVAPVLLRYLRERLESWIPQNISRLGQFAQRFRESVKNALPTVTQRRYFWEDFFNGPLAETLLNSSSTDIDRDFISSLDAAARNEQFKQGQVYLIGAGPGDPELLTFKALRLMQKADVVVYDRLVSPAIIDMVRRDAEKIYVGKAKSNHTLPQEDISQLLVDKAKQGHRVVRLKGGDPFIFGRGGEEIQLLVQHHIPFQVVPGITAASGAATYAGIPLTHRDYAQSVVFATGHLKDNSIDLDWPALAQTNQTVVFYMGLTGLPVIVEQLQQHGLDANTPIAIVENATLPEQRVIASTLADITRHPDIDSVKPPSLIIVGGVVSLHHQLKWFQGHQTEPQSA